MSNIKKFRIIKFKSKPILTAKNISKSFGKRVILRKIDMHLNKGEMLGLLGSNGAGKSTFMNIVLGLLKSDYGDMFLDSTKLTNLAIHERSKLGMAYLPQQTSIFRGLTVYENLLGIAQIVKKDSSEQREVVEKLMAEFSITHLRDIKATALSGGERRRCEIARCLINNPKILLLLGSTALNTLVGDEVVISKARGKWTQKEIGAAKPWIIASFHPAFLMRQPEQKKLAWIDLKMIRDKSKILKI